MRATHTAVAGVDFLVCWRICQPEMYVGRDFSRCYRRCKSGSASVSFYVGKNGRESTFLASAWFTEALNAALERRRRRLTPRHTAGKLPEAARL